MKYLIFEKNLFYLSDEQNKDNEDKGQSRSVSGYNAKTLSNTNMPQQYFNKKIVIYGRKTCPYCIGILDYFKTKPLLNKKVIFVDIEEEPSNYFSKNNLLNILKTNEKSFKKSHTTVPIVFYKGEFIGGSDDSKKYFDNE